MKNKSVKILALSLGFVFMNQSCKDDDRGGQAVSLEQMEAMSILNTFESDGGTPFNYSSPAVNYPSEANVYMPSINGVSYVQRHYANNPSGPVATFPMYKGLDSSGNDVDFIITESSNLEVAQLLGVPHSARMANSSEAGLQTVTMVNGRITFPGKVDFSGTRSVTAGTDNAAPLSQFPPAAVTPGAVADANWSSFCKMPSGNILNIQLVANSTGIHDRIPHHGSIQADNQQNPYLDRETRRVSLQILDGWASGRRYFYHLVTDASHPGPAAIELGVYAEKLNQLGTFGQYPEGSFLGFSPCGNGPQVQGVNNQANITESQGLNVAVQFNQEIDPVNVFPFGPENINYSPMWDAHVSMWTQTAVNNSSVRIIRGVSDLSNLIASGDVQNFVGNPSSGPNNALIANLKPTGLLINCPVVSQPEQSAIGQEYGVVLKP